MASDWLILADDLTGAADCAIAFGRRGRAAAVTWGEFADAPEDCPPVLAYDVASRGLSAAAAAARYADVLARLSQPGRILFKKIDSTLRGQPAVETAAAIAHLKAQAGAAFGVFAPAFPATGRTTIEGRVLVNGSALEDTEVWRRDHTYQSADLVEVLATTGIRGEKISLADVRGGDLKSRFDKFADDGDVVAVCDAETEHDLHLIAQASLPLSHTTLFIGSAGLAHALAGLDAARAVAPLRLTPRTSGTLFVVGSLATASRSAARALDATGTVAHVPVAPRLLLDANADTAALVSDVARRLASGGDVLVEIIWTTIPTCRSVRASPRGWPACSKPLRPLLARWRRPAARRPLRCCRASASTESVSPTRSNPAYRSA
jgi:uncharacterized protein YgbK (DUF1537 family)